MKPDRIFAIPACFSGIIYAQLLTVGYSDDNGGNGEPDPTAYPVTPFSRIRLTEVRESDAQPVTLVQAYLYESGRLTGYTGRQSITVRI